MHIKDLLSPEDVLTIAAPGKRDVLRALSTHVAARLGLDAGAVSEALLQRESLGSTGIGGGVALPHARMGIVSRVHGVFAALAKPVEYGAIDDRPVDLVFLLLLPAETPEADMASLACVARRLRQPGVLHDLRACPDPETLFGRLVGY